MLSHNYRYEDCLSKSLNSAWLAALLCMPLAFAACSKDGGSTPLASPLTRIEPGPPFTLSPGNPAGQDEDPAILRALEGSL